MFTAAKAEPREAALRIEKTLEAKLGVSARVTVISAEELAEVVAANPLGKVADNPSRLLVGILGDPADGEKLEEIARKDWGKERIALGYQRMFGHDLKHHFEPDALVDSMPLREPEGLGKLDFCEERFRLLVRTALENDKISVSRAAELLRLPLDKMQELRQSWLEEPGF